MRKGAKLGQHFLTGSWAAEKLTQSIAMRSGETILEIGPGKGALTAELLNTGARVVAVEKDETLIEILNATFSEEIRKGQLTIIREDIRNFDPSHLGPYVLAANIPYYITGEIIRQFLTAKKQPRALALLIQKEVADRILARNGKESILSLSVKAYGTPKIVAKVTRGNFSPPPSVDSAILLVVNISRDYFKATSEERFFEIVRAGFASKRKFLASNLSSYGKEKIVAAFASCGIGPKARAEDITLEMWGNLTRALQVIHYTTE